MFSPITLVPSLYTSSGLRVNSGETSEEFGSWNTIALCTWAEREGVNLLAPELFFLNLAHPVYKMWIIQEPNTLEL